MPPSKKRAAPADLPAMAEQLVAEPRAKANNLPVLLAALKPGCSQATPVLHSLRMFFVDAFVRGDLSGRKPAAATDDVQQSEQDVFASWLHRQYTAYQAGLLGLLGSAATDARTQVAALMAVMECVRSEQPGAFNNRLYLRLLSRVLAADGTAPEVLGLLTGRLAELADVRYFTLSGIIKLAQRATQQQQQQAQQTQQQQQQAATGPGSGAGAGADRDAAELDEQQEGGGGDGGLANAQDLARTLHLVLSELGGEVPGANGSELTSWCGAAEVGIAVPANAGEGARQRKRQRQAAVAAAAAGVALADQQRAKWANVKAQHRIYSDAWLAVLRMDFPDDVRKQVLERVHDRVIPALTNPLALADFLGSTLDRGGLDGMLALNGIFLLVTRHGLEYPRFYARLYQLFTPEVFHAKHRSRFFSLADAFLASGMVPAYTAAGFVKRLARLALSAPPAGALLALSFMHNIIRRHPATMQLLHRPPRGGLAGVAGVPAEPASKPAPAPRLLLPLPPEVSGGGEAAAAGGAAAEEDADEVAVQQQSGEEEQEEAEEEAPPAANGSGTAAAAAGSGGERQAQQAQQQRGAVWQGLDVFDFSEPDPGASRALESSLWELEAMRQHHNPQVAALCMMLDKDLRDRKKTSEADISDLLTASYSSMLAAEASRRLKAVPTAFYSVPPQTLFGAGAAPDFPGWKF